MNRTSILLASLLLLTSTCWAGETVSTTDKPSMSTSETVTITALVEAINHETREVTLRGPEGNTVSFVASEEARNLDQVEAGDIVMAEYVQSMSIEVMANDGFEPGAGEISAAGRSEKGEMPGMAAIDSVVVTATVEEINIEANTFKLAWPSGEILEYEAQKPENLTKAQVGDVVVLSFTEAIAMSLAEVPAE